ncbi:conserved hypothetical protein [Luteimonas sp. 9C]|uniref:PilZ domain-containing protein n=1 Tax=Luteimonas sp. 9C TaxID=2653148 RepID=UPI0012EEF6CB|nr:PilZ domain-containing protein [Luteimonas sp. 9C]VXC07498.1 conserved hypothetical protein [Luteimonas sp. 9C]
MSAADLPTLTPAQARDALFGDILTLHETRSATFLPGALDDVTRERLALQGEALLRGLAVIDDGAPRAEDPDQPADPVLLRLEAKLDVLTLLMTGFAAAQGAIDAPVVLTWSARGAEVQVRGAYAIGTEGAFRMSASDWLPTPLMVPATVVASVPGDDGVSRVWLRFGPVSPSLADALERHVFRIHRREVAEIRRR